MVLRTLWVPFLTAGYPEAQVTYTKHIFAPQQICSFELVLLYPSSIHWDKRKLLQYENILTHCEFGFSEVICYYKILGTQPD